MEESSRKILVPWSSGNDSSLTKRKWGFDSLRDDSISGLSAEADVRGRLVQREDTRFAPGATPEGFPPGSNPRLSTVSR